MSQYTREQLEAIFSEYQLIFGVDMSGSMLTCDVQNGQSRYAYVKELMTTFCHEADSIDQNGIDIVMFGGTVERFNNVTGSNIDTVLSKRSPRGGTPMLEALKEMHRGMENEKVIYIIFTDGEPSGGTSAQADVAKELVTSVSRQSSDEQQTHLFVQVGYDKDSTAFLKMLDDDLKPKYGAKYDAVDIVSADDAAKYSSLAELIMKAIND